MAVQVASLEAVLDLDSRGFERGIKKSRGVLSDLAGLMRIDLVNAAGAVTSAISAGVGAVADLAESSLMSAADLEKQMDGIAAVMGITADEAAPLKDLITGLGIDPQLAVDTFEAADAIEMLGKNGLRTADIMDGAAKSTIALANATGGDFAQSADIMTDVISLWNKEFRDADGNITDLNRSIDRISAVTTNSKFDLNDFALALAQGGGVAAASGVEFDDFAAAITAMSSSFASGSDAGTSFKTMLQRLAAPTDAARDLMAEMGFEAFDAAGNLLPMIDIVDNLNDTFKRMDEETKAQTLTELFGADAMRAAAALAGTTREEFAALQGQMEQTSAFDAAATRTDNFASKLENFQGILDGLKVQLGDQLLGPATKLLEEFLIPAATQYGPPMIEAFAGMAEGLADFLAEVDEQGTLGPLVENLGTLVEQTNSLASSFGDMANALGANNEEFTTMNFAIGALGGLVDALILPIQQMAGWAYVWAAGFDAVAEAAVSLSNKLQPVGEWLADKGEELDEKWASWLPGSLPPLAAGIKAVGEEFSNVQAMTPTQSGNTYNYSINAGGQVLNFSGDDREAGITAVLQMLRQQLETN